MRIDIHPVAEVAMDGSVRVIVWKREYRMVTIANTEQCPECAGLAYDEDTGGICQNCAGRGEIFNGTKEVERAAAKYALVLEDGVLRWDKISENSHVPLGALHSGHVIDDHGSLTAGDWQ